MASAGYEVREVMMAPRPVAGVRARVARGRVGQEFGRHLDPVYAAGRAGAVQLDGQNIFIYRSATADELAVDFCVGATEPFAAVGAVEPLETPQGPAATTTHVGDYARLGEAHAAVLAWCRAHNRALAGPSWEVYGHWNADPAQLRTEVYYLLQPPDTAAQAWNSAAARFQPRPAFSAFELRPGSYYRVIVPFADHDRERHEVGERWKFLRKAFLPYEDGLSLFVEREGREVHIRLQCREEEQGGLVHAFSDYVVEE